MSGKRKERGDLPKEANIDILEKRKVVAPLSKIPRFIISKTAPHCRKETSCYFPVSLAYWKITSLPSPP